MPRSANRSRQHRLVLSCSFATVFAIALLGSGACQSSQASQTAQATAAPPQTSAGGDSGEPSAAAPAPSAEPGSPGVTGEEVTYTAGDGVPLKGYLAYDASIAEPRPGVIVVHEWWGHNEYVRKRARMLAELGYVALALDMYGEGKHTEHPDQAQQFMQQALSHLDVAEKRFQAALDLLKASPRVDDDRIAAIGYCFGGGVVLHMARTGAPLAGVASFHGSLAARNKAEPGAVKAKLLVMTGAADSLVPEEQVVAFEQEMKAAGADFRVIRYPGAKHSFTNPAATAMGEQSGMPLAYDPQADAASWAELESFLQTLFHTS